MYLFIPRTDGGGTGAAGMKCERTAWLAVCLLAAGAVAAAAGWPGPAEWEGPAAAPAAPGDAFDLAGVVDPAVTVDPAAPVVAEWNRTVRPGESFTLTGERFTARAGAAAGSDTAVWVWADGTGGAPREAQVWNVHSRLVTATLPDDLPPGMVLVWVENEHGPGAPVCLNRTAPSWIGPLGDTAVAGEWKRVLGRNLTDGHTTTNAWVYLQPAAGGAFTACVVSNANPYAAWFRVPPGTVNGAYRVWAHNGNGGAWGWGDPLDLAVQTAWQRGAYAEGLAPSGGDDTAAIQAALDRVAAQPDGGTLSLAAGVFTVTSQLSVGDRVELAGAGMTNTVIEVLPAAVLHSGIRFLGDHVTVRDLSIIQRAAAGQVSYGIWNGPWPNPCHDLKLLRVSYRPEDGVVGKNCSPNAVRFEMRGCEASYRTATGSDAWIHGNVFHGGSDAESAIADDGVDRVIVEENHFETPDWPDVGGNRQYQDLLSAEERAWRVWCKRVFLAGRNYGSSTHFYVAHNTAVDVATDGNKGEMILFHGGRSGWFAEVLSCSGTTLTVRTDGTFGGVPGVQVDEQVNRPVPDALHYADALDDTAYVAVVQGPGYGQMRRVAAHTADTLTVAVPWRVPPASNSVVVLLHAFTDAVVYDNDLSAFPEGYRLRYSASRAVAFWANCAFNVAESNTVRRSWMLADIFGFQTAPSWWNEFRGLRGEALDNRGVDLGGQFRTADGTVTAIGPFTLGNAVRDCTIGVDTSFYWWKQEEPLVDGAVGVVFPYALPDRTNAFAVSEGNVVEHNTASGLSCGIRAGQWTRDLYRGNAVTTTPEIISWYGTETNAWKQPAGVRLDRHAAPILSSNTYAGADQDYVPPDDGAYAGSPAPLRRVARFEGALGDTFTPAVIPVANVGISNMAWSASTADAWITVSAAGTNALPPESAGGLLTLGLNPAAANTGRLWGAVSILAGGEEVRVGVRADLLGYRLSLQTEGAGSIGVSPQRSHYGPGETVTLAASPSNYWFFAGWSNDLSGTTSPAALVMSGDRSVGAGFEPQRAVHGVPLWWLAARGLSADDTGALSDTDGDTAPAWSEYWADTDPGSAASVLRILRVTADHGSAVVSWRGGTQARQWLEWRPALLPETGDWTAAATVPAPTPVTNQAAVAHGSGARVFRLRAERDE